MPRGGYRKNAGAYTKGTEPRVKRCITLDREALEWAESQGLKVSEYINQLILKDKAAKEEKESF